jgi:hypothetical protein
MLIAAKIVYQYILRGLAQVAKERTAWDRGHGVGGQNLLPPIVLYISKNWLSSRKKTFKYTNNILINE